MSDDLYQDAIVRHARASVRAGRLERPDASATVDNPLCGDRVIIDLKLDGEQIVEIAQHTRGCILCKASASIVAEHAIGETAASLLDVGGELTAMLKEGKPSPDGGWADLGAFKPVAQHKSRQPCVLLPFDALKEAFDNAGPVSGDR